MDLDEILESFVESIKPTKAWTEHANKATDRIFHKLKKHSKVSVNRIKRVGGMEKGTSTKLKADIDVVVFYEDDFSEECMRKNVLAEWQLILMKHLDVALKDIRRTNFLLSFPYDEVNFDLVAVKNNSQGSYLPEREQMKNDLDEVKETCEPLQASKALTLSAQSCKWFKSKMPFYTKFARLAKFWTQTVLFDKVVCGKSYLFEMLACKAVMKAAQRQPARSRPRGGRAIGDSTPKHVHSWTNCFTEFLYMVKNIDTLNELFNHSNGAWYDDAEIPEEVRAQQPLLMDPVNYFHNLLDIEDEETKEEFFRGFSTAAGHTLEKLVSLQQSGGQYRQQNQRFSQWGSQQQQQQQQQQLRKSQLEALRQLFFPQPLLHNLEDHPFLLKKISIKQVQDGSVPLLPKMKLRRMQVAEYEQQHYSLLTNSLLLNVASVVAISSWGSDVWGIPSVSAKEDVTKFFQITMGGPNAGEIFDGFLNFNNKDCKMSIPIGTEMANGRDDAYGSGGSSGESGDENGAVAPSDTYCQFYLKVGMNLKKKKHEAARNLADVQKVAFERRKLKLMQLGYDV